VATVALAAIVETEAATAAGSIARAVAAVGGLGTVSLSAGVIGGEQYRLDTWLDGRPLSLSAYYENFAWSALTFGIPFGWLLERVKSQVVAAFETPSAAK
jgi:hypothetical protein